VHRLPILVSGSGKEHLFAVEKITNGTGASQAIAVCETLREWNLTKRVTGINFDTTASNTGEEIGACTLRKSLVC